MYNDIVTLYQLHIVKETPKMLHHPYHTQKNKLMNQYVLSFVPKEKRISCTETYIAKETSKMLHHPYHTQKKKIDEPIGAVLRAKREKIFLY